MEGLIIRLSLSLLFGPPPKNKEHLTHLKEHLGVTLILNTCPFTNERTREGLERCAAYTEFFTPKDTDWENVAEEKEKLFITTIREPFDSSPDKVGKLKGRTKAQQQESLAQYYVQTAKTLKEKYIAGESPPVIYIHSVNGNMDEAYIAFALWYMTGPQNDLPVDLLKWIKEQNYEWLFEDDADKKQLLALILNEVKRGQKKTNFFKKNKI